MGNILVKSIGFAATILHEDPCAYDRYRWIKKRLKSGPLKTLDAGCGLGTFTMHAAKIGNHAVGLSFDRKANIEAQRNSELLKLKNIKFIECDLRYLDKFKKNSTKYDQILCLETIEHILDDKKLIKNLSDLLEEGGTLFLTTPYKNYKHLWNDKISTKEDGGHVRWGYTHDEMEKILSNNNLEIKTQEYLSGFVSQKLTNLSRILSHFFGQRIAWTITLPLRILQIIDRFITKKIAYPWLSIAVIATKNSQKSKI